MKEKKCSKYRLISKRVKLVKLCKVKKGGQPARKKEEENFFKLPKLPKHQCEKEIIRVK